MGKSTSVILCVDDNIETCEMLSSLLKQEGYEVITTQGYASGLIKAHSGIFDLFILDVMLPDGSGIELCREIRKFDKQTSVLFYSADSRPARMEEAMKAGAQGYLAQPVQPVILLETVKRLTQKRTESKP